MYALVGFMLATLVLVLVLAAVSRPAPRTLVNYEQLAPGADYYLDVATDTVVVREGGAFGSASYKQIADDAYAHSDLASLKDAVCVRTPSGCVYNSRMVRDCMPMQLSARREPPQEGGVPYTVFMTANSHACSPEARRRLLETLPAEYDFSFYDHAARRTLIAEFFEPHVLEAYDSCLAESYRRNMWALCVLYVYGGVYAARPARLPAEVQAYEFYFAGFDRFVSSVAGNPLVYDLLQRMCDNVRRRSYEGSASAVCGSALAYAFLETAGYGDWKAVPSTDAPEPRWDSRTVYADDYRPICKI